MLSYLTNTTENEPTIVLLHGFCENKNIWKSFTNNYSKQFRIISIDFSGFGDSPFSSESTTIEAIATQVHQTLESLKVEKCLLVGHSLGGYVTLAFAEKHPKMLFGIGLINSTAFADSEEKKQNRNKLIESLEVYGVKPFLSTFFNNLFYEGNLPKFEKEIQQLISQAQNLTADTLIQTTKAMRDRKSYATFLENTEIPVLFVMGKNDAILPLDLHREQFNLPKETMIYLADKVGHLAIFEAEIEVNNCIEIFVNKYFPCDSLTFFASLK